MKSIAKSKQVREPPRELTDNELAHVAGGRIRAPAVTVPGVAGPYTSVHS
ncbi:MAG TPA: bacteriocin [Xanthobacteraceae bacterium]